MKWLTTAEAVEILGIRRQAINRLCPIWESKGLAEKRQSVDTNHVVWAIHPKAVEDHKVFLEKNPSYRNSGAPGKKRTRPE